MSYQKLTSIVFYLTIFTVNAQELVSNSLYKDLAINSGLIITPQKKLLDLFETDSKKFEVVPTINSLKSSSTYNIMSLDNTYSYKYSTNLNSKLNIKKTRSRKEKTGRILTYIGVPLAIIGGIMVAGADELSYQCVNGDCTGDARGGFGIVLLGAGVGLSTTGIILWSSGSKK